MAIKFGGKQRRGLTTSGPRRRPPLLHYVVVRHGANALEVLKVRLERRGEAMAVFSAAWAARGYLFTEAPGRRWYVKACMPGELVSLLVGPCAGIEWVALDPLPGHHCGGEVANVMPCENFVDYLFGFTRPLSCLEGAVSRSPKVGPHCRGGDQ